MYVNKPIQRHCTECAIGLRKYEKKMCKRCEAIIETHSQKDISDIVYSHGKVPKSHRPSKEKTGD